MNVTTVQINSKLQFLDIPAWASLGDTTPHSFTVTNRLSDVYEKFDYFTDTLQWEELYYFFVKKAKQAGLDKETVTWVQT